MRSATEFAALAARSDDLPALQRDICQVATKGLGVTFAKLLVYDSANRDFLLQAGVGWPRGIVGSTRLAADVGTAAGFAWHSGQSIILNDLVAERRFRVPKILSDQGIIRSINVVVPGDAESAYGVLEVESPEPGGFSEHDSSFLQNLAQSLASAITRLALRGLYEEHIKGSSADRLAHAISSAGMSIWEWNATSDTLSFSQGFEALHGRVAGSLTTLAALQHAVHPDDRAQLRVALDQALHGAGGSLLTEFRVALPDGTMRWLRTIGHAEHDHAGLATRLAGVTQDISASHHAESHVAHLALRDDLTGLVNRHTLRVRLEDALLRSRRGEGCAVLALDLDRFKVVNDTFGHAVGDGVLRSVASRLLDATRETDVVARPGGDEFIVIQYSLDQPEDAEILATRIVARLCEPHEIDGHRIITGVSIGIAVAPQDGTDVDQVLRCADLALYSSKVDDTFRFRFFEPGMQARAQRRRQLVSDLRQALAAGEFELYYQPLIQLSQNQIIGFEALVRWRHPVRGLVFPDAFIPLAEETGLIESLEEWVLFRACTDAATWPSKIKVAVNLSAVQFAKGNLLETITAVLQKTGLKPGRLDLEITEAVLLRDTEATLSTMHHLQERGVSISMDGFGIDHASLGCISKFPFATLKIDRSLVAAAAPGTSGAAIIRTVAELCRSLGITTMAEGIGTLEQLQQVVSLGCTGGQGYFFSPPRPQTDVQAFLNNWSPSEQQDYRS
jgi:diguanylate cyclase (GGDEF)-like protein/PAS domain S-box-containing protein